MTTRLHSIPDFICLGVPRAGTTWLDNNLRLHPQVYLAEKEIHFFTPTGDYDFYRAHGYAWYYSQFKESPEDAITGEIAIHYLASDIARERISSDYPNMRFIVMLRNPVERFNSIYELLVGRCDFSGSLQEFAAEWRGRNQLRTGLYHEHIQMWLQACPAAELCIVIQDDIKSDPAGVYQKICRFIGADESFVPDTVANRVNEPKAFRSGLVRRIHRRTAMALSYHGLEWIRAPLKASGLPKLIERINKGKEYRVPIRSDDREWLLDYYRPDIEALEVYLNRDLSLWKC